MTLNMLQSLALAAAILLLGRFLNRNVAVLARYNIPQPVTGGLAFAGMAAVLHYAAGIDIGVAGGLRGPLLLAFFATVGLAADLGRLRAGRGQGPRCEPERGRRGERQPQAFAPVHHGRRR